MYNIFVQSYLEHWTSAVVLLSSAVSGSYKNLHESIKSNKTKTKDTQQEKNILESLKSSILSVGIETLLCVDALKFTECHLRVVSGQTQTQGQSEAHDSATSKLVHLVDRLAGLIGCGDRRWKRGEECDLDHEADDQEDGHMDMDADMDTDMKDVVLEFLPIFYTSYVQALYRHRGQLFTVGGGSTRDGYRNAACAFLSVVLGLVETVEGSVEEEESTPSRLMVLVWRTKVELLKVLCGEGGYVRTAADVRDEKGEEEAKGPQEVLSKIVSRVVGVLGGFSFFPSVVFYLIYYIYV
jgi:hypothetical protein